MKPCYIERKSFKLVSVFLRAVTTLISFDKARRPCALIFLFIGMVCPAMALNPDRQITQYGHTAWRLDEGIFPSAPHAIAQTADGYLWIGTETGLVRFDGVRFVAWTAPAGQSLPSTSIYSLAGTRDGGLWIGTASDVSRSDGCDAPSVCAGCAFEARSGMASEEELGADRHRRTLRVFQSVSHDERVS